jgi:hypothetical protein
MRISFVALFAAALASDRNMHVLSAGAHLKLIEFSLY